MNESLKQKVERAVGDEFVEWLNRTTGSEFQFERTGANPPDLVYRDGNKTLPVEVATSYYNESDAIMRWKFARKDPTAPTKWESPLTNPDQALIADINKRIAKKCLGKHDLETVLVVEIYPAITTKAKFEELKTALRFPVQFHLLQSMLQALFPTVATAQADTSVGKWLVGKPNKSLHSTHE
jgi:hypothetical protein